MELSVNKKGISAAVLKNIAVLTMTIDHFGAYILVEILKYAGPSAGSIYSNPWYILTRITGRIAFILYAFMIAEGAYRTGNRIKYASRLLICGIISFVPYSLCHGNNLFMTSSLNIFFLLFLGVMTIYAYDWLKEKISNKYFLVAARLAVAALACYLALAFHIEYGMMGMLLIISFYIFRYNKAMTAVSLVLNTSVVYMANVILANGAGRWIQSHQADLLMSVLKTDKLQIAGILALPLILLYNGEKGKQLPKWFYYLYYPVHLGIIAVIIRLI